jgi:two-component system response regulator VicR
MNIQIDTIFPQVRVDGKEIDFSKKEFDVFLFLWENKGKICTRNHIQNTVWGFNHFNGDRVADVAITRIRKKLEQTELRERLVTKKGFGYSLVI